MGEGEGEGGRFVLQGRGTDIGAPAEKKVVESWSVLGGCMGVRNLFSSAGVGQWEGTRCLSSKGSCRGHPGQLGKLS